MRRRDVITLLGGAFASPMLSPLRLRAEPADRVRRVGAIIGYAENDPFSRDRIAAFVQALHELGWTEGRNIALSIRFTAGDVTRIPALTKELIDQRPDVILASTTPVTTELARQTRAIPIVFVVVSDPVGSGFVASLARPGGNITGLVNVEASMGSKWLELLKEVAPRAMRAAILFNPETAPYAEYYLRPIETAGFSLNIETVRTPVRSSADIEGMFLKLGQQPGGGVIGISDSFLTVHRQQVMALALRYRLPTVFGNPESGALVTYAPDTRDLFQRSASYVDRILRGANPAELPVQFPIKFELAIDLKIAKALGLEVPDKLLAIADAVIE